MEQITKRQAISLFRVSLREANADSTFTNRFLYSKLVEHAKWMIPREYKAGKISQSKSLYQIIPCMPTVRVSKIDEKCPIKIEGLDIYRTEQRLPNIWDWDKGPIIRRITSIDSYTNFKLISASDWQDKENNPWLKKSKEKYVFYEDGYLWFPKEHPKRVNIEAYFVDDVDDIEFCNCESKPPCKRYLDTPFRIPQWILAEMLDKATTQIVGKTMQIPADTNINKNTNVRQ
jgi:hypothetical protein